MLVSLAIVLVKVVVVIGFLLTFAALLTWVERKQSAVMQDRVGANRADIFGIRMIGLFHPIADGIKMLTKEDFVPAEADRPLFILAPVIALFCALAAFATIPFGDYVRLGSMKIDLQVAKVNIGLLYVIVMLSMGIYGVVLAGWASRSNYSFLGGIRAAALLLSYELPLSASLIGVVMLYPSLELGEIARGQGGLLFGFLPAWGIFVQPLGFILFIAAGVAATKRIPFDLPEGESEIIGYFVEYSGIKFGMFMLTDLVETVVIAGLAASLFLGGWQFPYLSDVGFQFPGGGFVAVGHPAVVILQVLSFAVKVAVLCWFLMLVRWTLPRFRYDQAMKLGWLFLFPLSLLNIVATAAVVTWAR